MTEPTPAERKRQQLRDYTFSQLAGHDSVRGVVAIGSVADGWARPGSDIDAVVFMDPLDPYVCPAEFVWRPSDNTFHTIFSDDPELDRVGIQLDLHRLDLRVWRSPDFGWPEPRRAELADGWIAFDPTGEIGGLIQTRTAMADSERRTILDQAISQATWLLPDGDEDERWSGLGPVEALDRLQAGYQELVRGLFATHRRWRPWRSRQLRGLQRLAWLPTGFREDPAALVAANGHDLAAYAHRAAALRAALDELIERLQAEGIYGDDPDDEAFHRLHDEPGRAWNMDDWNAEHLRRYGRADDATPT